MKTRLGRICVLVATCVVFTAAAGLAYVVCPDGATVEGIAVNYYQGSVNWEQVAGSGVAFAFARFSDGLYIDPSFAGNYAGIKAAGMIRGVYQTLQPSQDPVVQANLLLAGIVNLGPGDLPPVLEVIETDGLMPSSVGQAVERWSEAIQEATGLVPIIYTERNFWNSSVHSPDSARNPLYIVHWGVACPNLPSLWAGWEFWQYAGSGSVPGVIGAVTRDVFNGPLDELRALARMPASSVPPPALFGLSSCPNPFNPRTTITYDLPEAGAARLAVFDLAGRLVRTLIDDTMPQGSHEAVWDGRDSSGREVGSGSYLARLEFGGKVEVVRMGLVR